MTPSEYLDNSNKYYCELRILRCVVICSVAVMAVSPEGAVCYWSDALRDNPPLVQVSSSVHV